MVLTREDILGADDIEMEEVLTPEWGGTTLVKALTGKERDSFEVFIQKNSLDDENVSLENVRSNLVARAACDPEKKPIFGLKDIEALGEKSAKALERVYKVAKRLSGIMEDDVKELVGNSESSQSEDSGLNSPSN